MLERLRTSALLKQARRLLPGSARLTRLDYGKDTQRKVRLIRTPARAPATPAERFAVEVLQAEGETFLADLIEKVARACYREEIRTGAWALDLGLLGAGFFVAQVTREIWFADGALWEIMPGGSESLELLSNLS